MDIMIIRELDGVLTEVPILRFKIGLFDQENYIVIGADTDGCIPKSMQPGFVMERLGRLAELHNKLMNEVRIVLVMEGWSFDEFPTLM